MATNVLITDHLLIYSVRINQSVTDVIYFHLTQITYSTIRQVPTTTVTSVEINLMEQSVSNK